jgi:uncharacterized membrane protein YuzA (DUF378 family)
LEGKKAMKTLMTIATILVIIGALNWGLIGLFNFDLVRAIFGGMDTAVTPATTAARVIYTLVGLSGLVMLSRVGDVIKA